MKNFLNISDLTRHDLDLILDFSTKLKKNFTNDLEGKAIGMIFENYSTRTRLSFDVGIKQLGGHTVNINFNELNFQRSESFEDTFKIFACYLDAIIFRTTNHNKLIEASNYFKKPIINALSDISHPCQIISDIFTLKNNFNKYDEIKISWFGDLNNVLYSLVEAVILMPELKLNIFTDQKIYNENNKRFPKSDKINFFFEIDDDIISNSNCIMTDVFISMNDEDSINKENLLKKFQINSNIMSMTNNECIFMHCLPAKIGSEVTEDVITSKKSIVLEQAENRLIAQKGILKWLDI